ncbi:hypothetical protein OQA88_5979 [Cercophora sp. LCS_1]
MNRHPTRTNCPRARRPTPRILHRKSRGLLLALALSTPAAAQTSAFTDQATEILFQRFSNARNNLGFGIALPTKPSDSFIGQLSFPLANGNGYGGLSLSSDREASLQVACWSDGAGKVIASLRQPSSKDGNPPEATGPFSIRPIASGTSANNTFLTFTFLCEGCLDEKAGLSASKTAGTVEMGWTLANLPVLNSESPSAILPLRNSDFGSFEADLAAARTPDFDKWAALAGAPLQPGIGAPAPDLKAVSGAEDGGHDYLRRRGKDVVRKTRRQAGSRPGAGRGKSSAGTDTDGGITSGNDSDSDFRGFAKRSVGGLDRVERGDRTSKNRRQTGGGGRGKSNTGTDTDGGLTSGIDSGNDTDSDFGGFTKRTIKRRASASDRDVARKSRRQAGTRPGAGRGQSDTDADGVTSAGETSGDDSDRGSGRVTKRSIWSVGRVGGGAAIAARQNGLPSARPGVGLGRGRNDTDRDGGNDSLDSGLDSNDSDFD